MNLFPAGSWCFNALIAAWLYLLIAELTVNLSEELGGDVVSQSEASTEVTCSHLTNQRPVLSCQKNGVARWQENEVLHNESGPVLSCWIH